MDRLPQSPRSRTLGRRYWGRGRGRPGRRGRASGRPRGRVFAWRRRGGRGRGGRWRWSGRRRVGIKPELLFPDRDHVRPSQEPLAFDSHIVHRRAVGTRIDNQVALGGLHDLRMASRHVLPRDDHVARGVAPKHERRSRDRVFTAVGQGNDAAAGIDGDFAACFGIALGLRHRLRNVHGLDVLSAAAAAFVDERQLLSTHLDFVPMEQRCRLGAEANPVDEDFGLGNCFGDDDLTVWKDL